MLSTLLKNKTNIVNMLTLAAGVCGYLAGQDVIASNPELVAGLLSAVAALNVIVRVFGAPALPAAK